MSEPQTVTILQLYPKDMNIYGDWGNTLTLKRRLEWRGYRVQILNYNVGDVFPSTIDVIVGGGGQDSGQTDIQTDLMKIADQLKRLASEGMPMLVICGLYQMFGHRFITTTGSEIRGIGLLDLETRAGTSRLIGNVTTDSPDFGPIVGYENHSGQTSLGPTVEPLAQVRLGAGNNEQDGHEGARYNNVIGSYLHGSLLPKNPRIADWLIEQALLRKYGTVTLRPIDDSLADQARAAAQKRPR